MRFFEERMYFPNGKVRSRKINLRIRQILDTWVKGVNTRPELFQEVRENLQYYQDLIFDCYSNILDHILNLHQNYIDTRVLQTMGSAAYSVAYKSVLGHDLGMRKLVRRLVYFGDGAFTARQLIAMELDMLAKTNWLGCQELLTQEEEKHYGPCEVLQEKLYYPPLRGPEPERLGQDIIIRNFSPDQEMSDPIVEEDALIYPILDTKPDLNFEFPPLLVELLIITENEVIFPREYWPIFADYYTSIFPLFEPVKNELISRNLKYFLNNESKKYVLRPGWKSVDKEEGFQVYTSDRENLSEYEQMLQNLSDKFHLKFAGYDKYRDGVIIDDSYLYSEAWKHYVRDPLIAIEGENILASLLTPSITKLIQEYSAEDIETVQPQRRLYNAITTIHDTINEYLADF